MRTILLTVLLAFGVHAASVTEITMGFNPVENIDIAENNSKLFAQYFEKKTGIKVKSFFATDYTALVEALRSNRIQFAWLPAFSFIKAEQIANAQVLMKAVRHGQPLLYSAIVTRADKGIKKLSDLKGKSIAWVDPASASGHIFPKAMLITRENIDPDTFFKRQLFAGSHEALVLAVANGTVDAGATFSNDPKGEFGAWSQFLKGKDVGKVTPIWISPSMVGDTVSTTKAFAEKSPDVVKATVEILAKMGSTDEGKKILMALYHIESMVPAKSSDFESLREAARVLKID